MHHTITLSDAELDIVRLALQVQADRHIRKAHLAQKQVDWHTDCAANATALVNVFDPDMHGDINMNGSPWPREPQPTTTTRP